MMKLTNATLVAVLSASLVACAAGTAASHQALAGGPLPVVILGFWHGLIAPITLIGEIIKALSPGALRWPFKFYENEASSVLYDLGFFVGLIGGPSALFGASRRGR